jgi:hypothetical protein
MTSERGGLQKKEARTGKNRELTGDGDGEAKPMLAEVEHCKRRKISRKPK